MTFEQLIDDVFRKEGDKYGDQHTRPPIDQPTARGGLTLDTVREYRASIRGEMPTVQTLKDMSHAEARVIVGWKLRQLAKRYGLDEIPYEQLRLQMIDYAYNSGPGLAIRWLQRVLGVERTSRMDARTVAALKYPFDAERIPVWIHQSLIAARLEMIDRATDPGGKVDHKYEEGLESRALTYSLLEVP